MTNSQCTVAGSSGQALIRSVRPVFTSVRCTRAESRGQTGGEGPCRHRIGDPIPIGTRGRVDDLQVCFLRIRCRNRRGKGTASSVSLRAPTDPCSRARGRVAVLPRSQTPERVLSVNRVDQVVQALDFSVISRPAPGDPTSPCGGVRQLPQWRTCAWAVSSLRPLDVSHTRRSQLESPSVPSEM